MIPKIELTVDACVVEDELGCLVGSLGPISAPLSSLHPEWEEGARLVALVPKTQLSDAAAQNLGPGSKVSFPWVFGVRLGAGLAGALFPATDTAVQKTDRLSLLTIGTRLTFQLHRLLAGDSVAVILDSAEESAPQSVVRFLRGFAAERKLSMECFQLTADDETAGNAEDQFCCTSIDNLVSKVLEYSGGLGFDCVLNLCSKKHQEPILLYTAMCVAINGTLYSSKASSDPTVGATLNVLEQRGGSLAPLKNWAWLLAETHLGMYHDSLKLACKVVNSEILKNEIKEV